MRVKFTDWAVALWALFAGILFLVPLGGALQGSDMSASLGAELWTIGNYVYIVVLVVSLMVPALGAVRRISRK